MFCILIFMFMYNYCYVLYSYCYVLYSYCYVLNSYCYVYVLLRLCMFRSVNSVSLCRSVYCLCVNVYCIAATGWQPNCS